MFKLKLKHLVFLIKQKINSNLKTMYSDLSFLKEYTEKKSLYKEDILKDLVVLKKAEKENYFLCYKLREDVCQLTKEVDDNQKVSKVFLVTKIMSIKVKVYIGSYFINLNEDIENQIIKKIEKNIQERKFVPIFLGLFMGILGNELPR
tara:strand:+ start:17584 stop:18027 length:444 start_codon:yes stop_codon:yes gene_type:complete